MVVGGIMKWVWEGLSDSYGRVYQMVVRVFGIVVGGLEGWL